MREAANYYVIEVADSAHSAQIGPPGSSMFGHLRRGVTVRARRQFPGTEVPAK